MQGNRQQEKTAAWPLPALLHLLMGAALLLPPLTPARADEILPTRDPFRPLIASTREPRFFVSRVTLNIEPNLVESGDIDAALVGLGTDFGLYSWDSVDSNSHWQTSWFAVALSQFNLDASSDDLVNTDYITGFPLEYRNGPFSMRWRLYHQSSHLGDEFLLSGNAPERVNLSVEVIDSLFALDWRGWRAYAGGGYLIARDPEDLKRGLYRWGLDYRQPRTGNRWIGGLDVLGLEERDWEAGHSLMIGYELAAHPEYNRTASVRLIAYDGIAPFGQFFVNDIKYYGLGIYFDL